MLSVIILVLCSAHLAYTLQLFMQPQMILHSYWLFLEWLHDGSSLGKLISKPLGLCPLCQMPYLVLLFAWLFGVNDWAYILIAAVSVTPYYQLLVRWTN
jgi:hypothetical protein